MSLEATEGGASRTDGGGARIVARLARLVEVGLAGVDLSMPQYRILVLLAGEPAAASKLADYLAVSPPSVTAVVDGLVARGLVERRSDPADRRRVTHVLTVDGASLLARADAAADERLSRSLGRIGDRDARRAEEALSHWARALDAERAARHADRAGAAAPAGSPPAGRVREVAG